jgi:hypoxanthine phosphoribosyltransferase
MKSIRLKDKTFSLYIDETAIGERILELARELTHDYQHKQPLFLAILNGSFIFATDLLKEFSLPCEISFVKLASYSGTSSSGTVDTLIGLSESLKGKDVVIIEDIVDTGRTMKKILHILAEHSPASIKIVTLLFKKAALVEEIAPDYTGFVVDNKFLVGYGLDYDGLGRNLREIYILNNPA